MKKTAFILLMILGVMSVNARESVTVPQKYCDQLVELAEAGNPEAMYILGFCYYSGDGVDKDEEQALKWIQLAADLQYPNALNFMGWAYDTGYGGLPEDDKKCKRFFRKAAQLGLPLAQVNYASKLLYTNIDEAYRWCEKAAEAHLPMAQYLMGEFYYNGWSAMVSSPDEGLGMEYFLLAAERDEPRAIFKLSEIFYSNSDDRALAYLERALEPMMLDPYDRSEMLRHLSACYRFGRCGAEVDEDKADDVMRMAAALGNESAISVLEYLRISK